MAGLAAVEIICGPKRCKAKGSLTTTFEGMH